MPRKFTKSEYMRLIREEGLTDLNPIYEAMAGDSMTFWKWYRDIYQKKQWDPPKKVVRDLARKELRRLKGKTTREAAQAISEKFGFNISRQLIVTIRRGDNIKKSEGT